MKSLNVIHPSLDPVIGVSVFDKLIWCIIGPKSFLFGTAHTVLSLGQMAQLIMIILPLTSLTLC